MKGAVDQKGYEAISEVAERTRVALEANRFTDATNLWGSTETAVGRNTYGIDFYNILKKITGKSLTYKTRDGKYLNLYSSVI
ncbi:hypothetical protein NQ314_011531 [Rhamnusium bicolor]|uniref:Uncharacterized protein n=1 Tax=Rhamnusium bicolor TaxID=1586634 RepID=A0AAV8XH98_9CUCU|nr:hypothetical protein NQ314_011531 [Rhamnusium bicolor]